jgi:hypothetical protein
MSRPAILTALIGAALAVTLVGCATEPTGVGESAAPTASPGSSEAMPSPTLGGSPSATAAADALPKDCAALYSPAMSDTLSAEIPPLNDPGIEMLSTTNAALLETLQAVPSLRCTWGPPGERGITTTVARLDSEQRESVLQALQNGGFGCDSSGDATICRLEQRGVSLDDVPYTRGETHAVTDDAWVATAWLNVSPDGYTEDILAQLAR